ncbi:Dabb family protein [Gehongia tenuis]|uniref:Dabb family protein n=1 Tax=Gehongia tenuis TaxID=2763655 RepID=A0A926D0T2_9FIRM|nr:Dabb family protein [Gehongia tenuis]MBC8530260.1 Dabb family protein [Gehongia tenuis]
MVKHIVLWKLKDEAEGNGKDTNMRIIKERLEALVGVVPGLLKLEVGFNYVKNDFDLCLYSEFVSNEALENYDSHPAHLAVREFVSKVRLDRIACNYEI